MKLDPADFGGCEGLTEVYQRLLDHINECDKCGPRVREAMADPFHQLAAQSLAAALYGGPDDREHPHG